ncbi:hypothetical protein QVO10_18660, partial [Bacteroides gallinaceum]
MYRPGCGGSTCDSKMRFCFPLFSIAANLSLHPYVSRMGIGLSETVRHAFLPYASQDLLAFNTLNHNDAISSG